MPLPTKVKIVRAPRWLENGRRLLSGSHACSFVRSDLGSVGDKQGYRYYVDQRKRYHSYG